MKKALKIITIILSVMLLFTAFVACGGTTTTTGVKVKKTLIDGVSNGNYTVYKYVDEKVDGNWVTKLDLGEYAKKNNIEIDRISTNAFKNNEHLEEVIIPDTVTTIEKGAFAGMKNLSVITLPFIGKSVNADAYLNQTASAIDKAVDSERTFGYIFDDNSFTKGFEVTQYYNSGESSTIKFYIPITLTKVVLKPSEEYDIPWCAFNGLTGVQILQISENVNKFGDSACKNFTSLEKIVNMDGNLILDLNERVFTGYDETVFYGCTNLKNIIK